ncbi:helix-turn-helix transcriptional regulator [Streptomyces sp. NPDC005863]|uniref:helix-turn-helix transcriptional regulator n=1 Tax=unclassified Streptomyces TaxID=2593676 RepID=UPI0033C144A2
MTLGKQRRSVGYSQERLAELLGVDRRTVGRWECGKVTPQPSQRPELARLLRMTPHELDRLIDPSPASAPRTTATITTITPDGVSTAGVSDDMIRREFLRLVAVTGALSATGDDAAAEDGGIDPRVGTFAAMNAHLWQVYQLARSKQAVYPLVHDQMAALTDRLAEGPRSSRSLISAAGDLFQLAGELAFDQNRYTDAAAAYTLAASAGKDTGSFDLWACALVRHAYVDVYEGRYRQAISTLDAAEHIAGRGDRQLTTRHWVASVQAEAYAGLGEFELCERALDQAQTVTAGGVIGNGGWLRFDGSRLAEERGARYVQLGRFDLAEHSLQAALRLDALAPGLSPRRRGAVLTDLAAIGARRHDVDQLTTYAGQALTLARESSSGYVARRLGALRTAYASLSGDRRVAELDAHIGALTVWPSSEGWTS